MGFWKETAAELKSEWPEMASDLWKEFKTLLRIAVPVVIVSVISLFLWFMRGYILAAWLVDQVAFSYRENPTGTVMVLGFILIIILLLRYTIRRANIVQARRQTAFVTSTNQATAGMVSLNRVRPSDPMPAEMKAVAKKHGQRVAEYAIAKSTPGDSLEEIMTRADNAMLDVPPLTLVGIARHEAAHTLAAHAMGAVAIKAEIYDVEHGGNARWAYPEMLSKPQNFCWISIVVAVAGNLVDQDEGRINVGSHRDLRTAEQDVYAIISTGAKPDGYDGELDASALISGAREKARSILGEHRNLYEKLADELLEHRRLNSHQIRDILGHPSEGGR